VHSKQVEWNTGQYGPFAQHDVKTTKAVIFDPEEESLEHQDIFQAPDSDSDSIEPSTIESGPMENFPGDLDFPSESATDSGHSSVETIESGPVIAEEVQGEAHQEAPTQAPARRENPARTTRYQGSYALIVKNDPDMPTLKHALQGEEAEKWRKSIDKELASHELNGTWEVCDLPAGQSIVDSKFVLKKKRDSEGNVSSFKVRLVARGFTQHEGIDYHETFAPVSNLSTIMILLTVAAEKNLELGQMDIETAYLNAPLKEEVYLKPPELLNDLFDGKVLRLRKALYGLKQAAREWNLLFTDTLRRLGWTPSINDPCLFTRKMKGKSEYLIIYVDDILIAAETEEAVALIKREIGEHFRAKDLGELSFILGIKVTRNRSAKKIWLSQEAYIDQLVQRFDVKGYAMTPMTSDTNPVRYEGTANSQDIRRYQEIIGSLLYAARCTRPDISNAVGLMRAFQLKPWSGTLQDG
jgi:hypothetical protein